MKPVNLDALSKWVGHVPEDVVRDMASVAPMLSVLGYDPNANPPNYGKPDDIVVRKTNDVRENGDDWYKKAVAVVNDPQRVDKPFNYQQEQPQQQQEQQQQDPPQQEEVVSANFQLDENLSDRHKINAYNLCHKINAYNFMILLCLSATKTKARNG